MTNREKISAIKNFISDYPEVPMKDWIKFNLYKDRGEMIIGNTMGINSPHYSHFHNRMLVLKKLFYDVAMTPQHNEQKDTYPKLIAAEFNNMIEELEMRNTSENEIKSNIAEPKKFDNKRVFISHASEDKNRFVMEFAKKLRSKGIDAWVDEWEMLPGDKLVSKIFDVGIKNADVIIIVLSKNSINKPWVKEEIDASFLKRIENQSRIIPIIIDECEVPECLKSTLHQKITDLKNYNNEFKRIVLAINNDYIRPPLGEPPKYEHSITENILGLELIDTLIMKISCEYAMRKNDTFIQLNDILDEINSNLIDQSDLFESLEILERKNYIKNTAKGFGGVIEAFFISNYGFEKFAQIYIQDYDEIKVKVIFELVNQHHDTNLILQKATNIPIFIIDRILGSLDEDGFIKMCYQKGEEQYIFKIYPELKRFLKKI